MGVAVLGDRLFIVGGFDGQAYLNVVEAFDPLTNLWTQVIFPFFLLFENIFNNFLYNYCSLLRYRRDVLEPVSQSLRITFQVLVNCS